MLFTALEDVSLLHPLLALCQCDRLICASCGSTAASAWHLHRNPGLFLMGTQGVEKSRILRILTSGNDGFQDIGYPEKYMFVFVLKRASIRVSLGTNTVGSCGRVQGSWCSGMETAQQKKENKIPSGLFFKEKKLLTLANLITLRQKQGE